MSEAVWMSSFLAAFPVAEPRASCISPLPCVETEWEQQLQHGIITTAGRALGPVQGEQDTWGQQHLM